MKKAGWLKCCKRGTECPYPVCVNDLTRAQREEIARLRRMQEIEKLRAEGVTSVKEIAARMGVGVRTIRRTLAKNLTSATAVDNVSNPRVGLTTRPEQQRSR